MTKRKDEAPKKKIVKIATGPKVNWDLQFPMGHSRLTVMVVMFFFVAFSDTRLIQGLAKCTMLCIVSGRSYSGAPGVSQEKLLDVSDRRRSRRVVMSFARCVYYVVQLQAKKPVGRPPLLRLVQQQNITAKRL